VVYGKESLGRKSKVFFFSSFIILISVFLVMVIPEVNERIETGYQDVLSGTGTYGQRIKLLSFAWDAIHEGGLIKLMFGTGFETIASFTDNTSVISTPFFALQSGADSALAYILFRLGLLGLILYVFFCINYFRESLSRFTSCNALKIKYYLLTGPAMLVWALVIDISGNMFSYLPFSIILIASMGISEITYRLWLASLRRDINWPSRMRLG